MKRGRVPIVGIDESRIRPSVADRMYTFSEEGSVKIPRIRVDSYLRLLELRLCARRSPTIIVVTLVLARTQSGIMEASAMYMLSRPRTLNRESTTASGLESVPIAHVLVR